MGPMYAIAMSGKIGSDPTPITDSCSLMQSIDLAFNATYDGVIGGALTINASDGSPFVPALGAIVAVRAVAVRAVDGQSLVVKLTSAAGIDQAIPVSDLMLVRAQNANDQFTAIKIVGVGRIELLLAGNNAV
jgi:hypothetical protein